MLQTKNTLHTHLPTHTHTHHSPTHPHMLHTHPHTHTAPGYLYNFTIESCINPCKKPKPAAEEEPPGSPTSTMDELDIEIMKMKAVLKFHFMNPFEKWKYASKRRFPWKFVLQLASIILVTAQVRNTAQQKIFCGVLISSLTS